MTNSNTVKCPNCGTDIDVNAVLFEQVNQKLKGQYESELHTKRERYKQEMAKIEAEKKELAAATERQQQEISRQVEAALKQKETDLTIKIKSDIEKEQSSARKILTDELAEKTLKINKLNQAVVEVEKLKREKDELKSTIQAEAECELNRKLSDQRQKIQAEFENKAELKIKELERQLAEQKTLTEEMRRKQEQVSQQAQGEAQELAIEEYLRIRFPLDTIEEIKKGERGADSMQVINTRARQNCGKIYYESKRTKVFQNGWIEKFKADIRDKNADIGVIVTEVMPADMERMGIKDGVWICTYSEFKGLCLALRESIVRMSRAAIMRENQADKMVILYRFLTGNEFRLQVEGIVEGFVQLKSDLDTEKRAMQKIWSKREKQLDKVLTNTIRMYGSIKGIAGDAIQSVPMLELPGSEDDAQSV